MRVPTQAVAGILLIGLAAACGTASPIYSSRRSVAVTAPADGANLAGTTASSPKLELYLVPNLKAAGFPQMFDRATETKWPTVLRALDGVGLYSENLWTWDCTSTETCEHWRPEDFKNAGRNAYARINGAGGWGKKLTIEMPVLNGGAAGTHVCTVQAGKDWLLDAQRVMDTAAAAGSHVDIFKLDEPLIKAVAVDAGAATGLRPEIKGWQIKITGRRDGTGKTCEELGFTYDEAGVAGQVVAFMREVKIYALARGYPVPKFIAAEAGYPWFRPAALARYQQALVRLAAAAGLSDLYLGLALDSVPLASDSLAAVGYADYKTYYNAVFDPAGRDFITGQKYMFVNAAAQDPVEFARQSLEYSRFLAPIAAARAANGLAGIVFQSWQTTAEAPASGRKVVPPAFAADGGENASATHVGIVANAIQILCAADPTVSAACTVPQGFLYIAGRGAYVNDRGQYCAFTSREQWLAKAGNGVFPNYPYLPAGLVDAGECTLATGFFYFQGGGYYANDKGQYCRVTSSELWTALGAARSAVPTYPYLPSSMQGGVDCALPAGPFQYGNAAYWANDAHQYCRLNGPAAGAPRFPVIPGSMLYFGACQ